MNDSELGQGSSGSPSRRRRGGPMRDAFEEAGKAGKDQGSPAPKAPVCICDRYQITGELGSGHFGVVYKAYDVVLKRKVAIKVPHRVRVAELGDIEAYLAEARVLASLDHQNIVRVYDYGRTDDGLCFAIS